MSKNKKAQKKDTRAGDVAASPQKTTGISSSSNTMIWIVCLLSLTALSMFPMLSNEFTNWDDLFYVTSNKLLIGPDYKGIFSEPIVSNYHPLTILSLAFNYQMTQLGPISYLITNLLLHLANTTLVFWLVRRLSDGNNWVAFFTAAVFGIHPMHVESVAWVSERKDVLYTLFFLASLLSYWKYLVEQKIAQFWLSMLFFVLSLLSKPAAIVLPGVLLLLDYYKGRGLNSKVIIEKIPSIVLALVFAIVTLKIQALKAVSSFDSIPILVRPLYACYAVMTYFVRFVVPYPLSAFHPYPPINALGWQIYIAPVFVIALAAFAWIKRRDRVIIFGLFFYIINLLLVLQIISFGNTIVSERYTYVPYIGLAFSVAMVLSRLRPSVLVQWVLPACILATLGYMSFERTKVWHDSLTLWTDVISHYPITAVPRTNRANHVSTLAADPAYAKQADAMHQQVLGDCDTAIRVDPKHTPGYRIRGVVLLRLNRPAEAIRDADSLKKLMPNDPVGFSIGGSANLRTGRAEQALADFNTALSFTPDDPDLLNSRGTTYFNLFRKYPEAMADFNRALKIKTDGGCYLNRSRCYYMMGDLVNARADAQKAIQLKTVVSADYQKLIGM